MTNSVVQTKFMTVNGRSGFLDLKETACLATFSALEKRGIVLIPETQNHNIHHTMIVVPVLSKCLRDSTRLRLWTTESPMSSGLHLHPFTSDLAFLWL